MPAALLSMSMVAALALQAAEPALVPPPTPAPATPAPTAPAVPEVPASRSAEPQHDQIRVVIPADRASLLETGSRDGRIIVCMVAAAQADGTPPANAPFYDTPQPIFSAPVHALAPGQAVVVGVDAAAFPVPLDELNGSFQIQAVFDRGGGPTHMAPGNLLSEPQTVWFDSTQPDDAAVELVRTIEADPAPSAPNFALFSTRSAILSAAAGKDVYMRAGVAVPQGWADPSFKRRMWPAVFVIPDRGGRDVDGIAYAKMLGTEGSAPVVPQAVWIVLDPNGPWGHHAFLDSPANGPRMQALLQELIPELTRQFRLIARPEARILLGNGMGAWAALWLQLTHPDEFGACFVTSPTPVDLSAFQTTNLYTDLSVFTDADGKERPAYRVPIIESYERIPMTVRDSAGMAFALSPSGRSGEVIDCLSSNWSTVDPQTQAPRRMFDQRTGIIDRSVINNEWSRYDIVKLLRSDPAKYAPIFRTRVRLQMAERDNFFLQRAAEKLRTALDEAAAQLAKSGTPLPEGPGSITMVPGQTHFTLPMASMMVWQAQMRKHLHEHGLD